MKYNDKQPVYRSTIVRRMFLDHQSQSHSEPAPIPPPDTRHRWTLVSSRCHGDNHYFDWRMEEDDDAAE